MLVATSPDGLVTHIPSVVMGIPMPRAVLWDFDIDGDRVKPNHLKWLNEQVISFLPKASLPPGAGRWVIHLTGSASRTAKPDYNWALSKRRAERVHEHLKARLASLLTSRLLEFNLKSEWAEGETAAERAGLKDETEHPYYRSVEVAVAFLKFPPTRVILPPPKVPEPLAPVVFPRKLFRMRLKGGSSIGVGDWIFGVKKVSLGFEIWDVEESLKAAYVLEAGARTVSLPSPVPISADVTLEGLEWNPFTTPRPHSVNDFEGMMRIGWSIAVSSGIDSRGTPFELSFGDVHFPDFKTGPTFGIPDAGFTEPILGNLELIEKGRHFTGD